jgi:hypothetical protein
MRSIVLAALAVLGVACSSDPSGNDAGAGGGTGGSGGSAGGSATGGGSGGGGGGTIEVDAGIWPRDAMHSACAAPQPDAGTSLSSGSTQALSLAWAAYATAAIVVGIRRRYAPIRYFAMLLFAITILKVFVVDMAELERVYRIVSVIGLGVMLLATSYLYQRFKDVLA